MMRADHGLRQAAHLEALLEIGLRDCAAIGLARQVALDAALRRLPRASQPDHRLQHRRAVGAEEHRLGHGVARGR